MQYNNQLLIHTINVKFCIKVQYEFEDLPKKEIVIRNKILENVQTYRNKLVKMIEK